MNQYIVAARSPSLAFKEEQTEARYLDDKEAAKDAAHWAKSLNTNKYLGTNDWEAWVLVQKHQPL